MNPIELVKLDTLMRISEGDPRISIGIIDGPVDRDHPNFKYTHIKSSEEYLAGSFNISNSLVLTHGTFVLGILSGLRNSFSPAICPRCKIILRPIFNELRYNTYGLSLLASTAEELSEAIKETIRFGAKIINLSLGIVGASLYKNESLNDAYSYARQNDVILIMAAGNHGTLIQSTYYKNSWILPVSACDEYGYLSSISNIGPSIAFRGIMAPGINIISTSPGGNYRKLSGTSFATPFVTGTIALLWSIFPKASSYEILESIVKISKISPRTIVPKLLDAESSMTYLGDLLS